MIVSRLFVIFFSSGLYFLLCIDIATAGVYEGTLGGKAIILELSKEIDSVYSGRYFYKKGLVDIELSGTLDQLKEYPTKQKGVKDQSVGAVWKGQLTKRLFTGTRISSDGLRTLPFLLKRFNEKEKPPLADYLNDLMIASDLNIYDILKMQRPLQKGPETVIGKVAYQIVVDPITKAHYPMLTRHPNPDTVNIINHLIEAKLWEIILQSDGCDSVPAISVNYLSETLFDLNHSGSIHCGGAYPNNFNYPSTYDLVRQQEIKWTDYFDVYQLDENATPIWDNTFLQLVESKLETELLIDDKENPCNDFMNNELFSLGLHVKQSNAVTVSIVGAPQVLSTCEGDIMNLSMDEMKPWVRIGVPSLF